MSAETVQQPYFGGREAYNQTPFGRLEECEIITVAIDAILRSGRPSGSSENHAPEYKDYKTYLSRSFEYLEKDSTSDCSWPLTGKRFDILYACNSSPGTHTHETYTVTISTFVHQGDAENVGMQNSYTIEYFGADRSSATSVIWQPNFVEPSEPNMVTRDTTPYDQEQLFNELTELQSAIDAGEQENSIIAALNSRPE